MDTTLSPPPDIEELLFSLEEWLKIYGLSLYDFYEWERELHENLYEMQTK